MEVVSIFADHLYSFQYKDETHDEFARLFNCWQDPEFLEDFFDKNQEDLFAGFYDPITIEKAIINTLEESEKLRARLNGIFNSTRDFDSLFTPLSKNEVVFQLKRVKASGSRYNSWLRIYAIKVQDNVYVITGGAIKLTGKMQERDHTSIELKKFKRCFDYLRENQVQTLDGINELCL